MSEPSAANETSATSTPKASGRRRFLGAGVAASPAILTLASSPALATGAGGGTCITPSRSLSRNLSKSQKAHIGYCTPKYSVKDYCDNKNWWPAGCTWNKTFKDCFGIGWWNGSKNREYYMHEILTIREHRTKAVAALITAYLNALHGLGNTLAFTKEDAVKIYREHTTGGYRPFGNAPVWTDTDIWRYLLNNFIIKPSAGDPVGRESLPQFQG